MENSIFVDIFLIVTFLMYLCQCWRWTSQNRDAVLRIKNDTAYSQLALIIRPLFLLIMTLVLVWLGFMCWLLFNCLAHWHAEGSSAYLLLVLFAVIAVWQIGLAQYCKLILIFAKSRGISE